MRWGIELVRDSLRGKDLGSLFYYIRLGKGKMKFSVRKKERAGKYMEQEEN